MQASCGREYSCLKRRKPLSTGHGHISQIVGRSTFDSPPDRHFEKTSRFTSRHSFIAFSVQGRRKKDVSRYESKTLRCGKSTMGKAKTYRRQQSSAKERRTHTSGTKETFPTDESSVGSKKESCRRQNITYGLRLKVVASTGMQLVAVGEAPPATGAGPEWARFACSHRRSLVSRRRKRISTLAPTAHDERADA